VTSIEAGQPRLVLASASPRRLALLELIGLTPDLVAPADIDESERKDERPRQLALRLAVEKGRAARAMQPDDYILSADTVVACGRRILPKAETEQQARDCLKLLSGRGHDVLTGVAVLAPDGREASRVVETRVTFKRLTLAETEGYIASGEWRGKAGGYGIQGRAGALVRDIAGSYPSVMGLPLYETVNLLEGLGYPVGRRWDAGK
jgi:septum formation protein